jgi:hypothetical protein
MAELTHLALGRGASIRGAWSTSWACTVHDEEGRKRAWAAYRQARAEIGLPNVSPGYLAYAACIYVGHTHEEGIRVDS